MGGRLHAVVGDVHGSFDMLLRLEDKVARHAAREGYDPLIVCVGDLVDRGPDSAAVVRHVRLGCERGTHAVVMGNHEAMMLAALQANAAHLLDEAGAALPSWIVPFSVHWERKATAATKWLPREVYLWYASLNWLAQGGVPTLQSYGSTEPTRPSTWVVDPDDLRFLAGLPLVFSADGLVVTHALLESEAFADLTSDDADKRQLAADTALWGRKVPKTAPTPGRTHVSGHSPLDRVRRRERVGVVQVDTGAFYGRRLSAWCAETDQVLSVGVSRPPPLDARPTPKR